MAQVSTDLQIAIEQFLYREARLLEENRFKEWVALFTEDTRYRLPVRRAVQPGAGAETAQSAFNLFDDDKASLELRTLRLESGYAHSESPFSITMRLVSNISAETTAEPDMFEVASRFYVHQERLGRHTNFFVGKRQDTLVRDGASFLIRCRNIELAQTILPSTISIFL